MASYFVDSVRGMGLPLTADELKEINTKRQEDDPANPPPILTHSPGARFLKYGKQTTNTGGSSGKEGSWDNAKMVEQLRDFIDAAEVVYPEHQLQFQFDWSSGHSKRSDDGLCVAGALGCSVSRSVGLSECASGCGRDELELWRQALAKNEDARQCADC